MAYTPGHASHHVCYLDEDTGDAYVGDMAGVRLPPHEYTVAPTPPPDIDVDAWLDSIDLIEAWQPTALCLTHFGRFEDVPEQLERARESLRSRAAPGARARRPRSSPSGRRPRPARPWTPRPPRR